MVTITFNVGHRPMVSLHDNSNANLYKPSSAIITSTDLGLETRMEANKYTHSTIVVIHTSILLSLVDGNVDIELVRELSKGDCSFWMDTQINPRLQALLFQLDEPCTPLHLPRLFYTIKVQQLIYELLDGLLGGQKRQLQSLKAADIDKMYSIKQALLSNLSRPPSITKLAREVCMSGTKLNLVFRQVFGNSVYNYYQTARLEEASRLLRDLSVAETSYRLGFVNPGYFSRLFAKRFKVAPKQFSETFYSKKVAAPKD